MVILLGHMMYGNPQIHAESEHYPEQNWAILLIVIRHVSSICDADGTDEKIMYSKDTSQGKIYTATRTSYTACIQKLSCRHRMENLPDYPCYNTRILPLTGS